MKMLETLDWTRIEAELETVGHAVARLVAHDASGAGAALITWPMALT